MLKTTFNALFLPGFSLLSKRIWLCLLLIFGLLYSCVTNAAVPIIGNAENATWEIFTARQTINSVFPATKEGYLWIATEGGLEKRNLAGDKLLRLYTTLDGFNSNEIMVLTGDCQAGVWVGTPGGIYHVLASGALSYFVNAAVTHTGVLMAPDCHGGLWFSTGQAMAHIKADTAWEEINRNNSDLPSDDVRGLGSDGANGVFIGTNAGVAWRQANGTWQIFNQFNSALPDNDIQTLISDGAGGFWVEIADHVVHRHANGEWQGFDKSTENWPNGQIRYANQAWMTWIQGTENTMYRMVDGQWQAFSVANSGITDNAVWALHSENADNLLVWTGDGWLLKLSDQHWESLQKPYQQLLQFFAKVTALAMDEASGGLWVRGFKAGSNDELLVFFKEDSFLKNSIFEKVLKINNLTTNLTTFHPDGQNGIWFGTSQGLFHRLADGSREEFNPTNSGLPDSFIHSIISDENGGIWIGTEGGLAHRYADGSWKVFKPQDYGDLSNAVSYLHSDGSDGIWIATTSKLSHIKVSSTYEIDAWDVVYTNSHPDIAPDIFSIQRDNSGGIWASRNRSTISALVYHYDADLRYVASYGVGGSVVVTRADGNGGLWVGANDSDTGLTHIYDDDGTVERFNTSNSGLPSNDVNALQLDGKGGLWIGTDNGLAYLDANRNWESDLHNRFQSFQANFIWPDGIGGYWMGTESEFGHLTVEGRFDRILSVGSQVMHHDGQDGFYVGATDGLHHFTPAGDEYVEIPNGPYNITALLFSENGLWVGTNGKGLLYQALDGSWNTFTTDNSRLPNNYINSLFSDGSGGVVVWTAAGNLAHLKSTWTWEIHNLIPKKITSVMPDGIGGYWVGTEDGLEHVKADMNVESFSAGLPNRNVRSLAPDGRGGLYAGTLGGLAHLSFGHQAALIEQVQQSADTSATETETEESLTIIKGQRAAILIAGGGSHHSNTLWDTTESISNYLYKVFNNRGFLNDEIYYLSPKSWADFNGDGLNDHIVDAPKSERLLTVDDVRDAFAWAKNRGKLDQPLYVFFLDHGSTTRFQLGKLTYLDVLEFKDILDDYQNTTGNEMVLVIEACYSGVLLEQLIAPNRAIISSTGNGLAYFDRMSRQGFSRFLAIGLAHGMNFYEAFEYANHKQTRLLGNISKLVGSSATSGSISQVPQLNDGNDGHWLRQLYLNGSFVTGDLTLAIEGMTSSTTLTAGQSMTLQAKAVLAAGNITRVWAVLRPPRVNLVMDSNGTPILAFPRLSLSPTGEPDIWETTWQDAVYNGDYEITFYAEDNEGNIASSDNPLIISIIGGVESPPQATVQLVLEKDSYRPGEPIKAGFIEDLGWGYDLYAAVVLPDGHFIAFKNTNDFAPINDAKQWLGLRSQNSHATLLDFTLPANLPTGEYCLYGILSPEKEDVFETLAQGLWVMEKRCFEVLP